MDTNFVWVVLQAVSVVSLAAVGLLPTTRSGNGILGLSRAGMLLLFLGGAAYIGTTATIQVLNKKEQDRSNNIVQQLTDEVKTLTRRIDRLYDEIANSFMAQRVLAPSAKVPAARGKVHVDLPKEGDRVGWKLDVSGSGAAPKESVWLIVHPMETGAYWVQPPIAVGEDGAWHVQAYMGRAGAFDVGKRFELTAVANPTVPLMEGQVLDHWPEGEAKSNVVGVIRR